MIEYTGYSIDITNANSESIMDLYDYKELTIIESLHHIPYYELLLFGTDYDKLVNEKTLTLQYNSEQTNYTVPLGINLMKIEQNNIRLYGWLTEWENFKTSNTQFLGDNLKDALLSTNIRKEITWNNNFAGNFFQVNNYNMLQCLDLCLAAAETPFWHIGRTNIVLSNNTKEAELDLPDVYQLEVYAQEAGTEVTSENSDKELFTGAYYKNAAMFADGDLASCFENCLYNYKQRDFGLRYYLTFSGTTEYSLPVGTLCSNPIESLKDVKNWVVVSIVYCYNKNGVECKVTLGGITA